ncbi:MAG: 1-(5-phosphoribosyl)-5-[(5-phosphoribosylamino)methylideneamino]imidazole-4-carboxamide isomerase [Firmicutes bacterium]|nr:1-(5-phosphoribosyl)-5-[(5-phosphoribosylamino)methylideneamino]imidazole-4-carboxamide isomerase [Bacillota bacterium]
MLVIPAIDLLGGRCVRLRQGDYNQETVYSEDPVEVAVKWASLGAERLHLVDLDAARRSGENRDVIKAIAKELAIPIEVGGGLRSMANLEEVFAAGARYGIIGTAAYRDPRFVAEAVKEYGDRIIVGIDARDGQVAVEGWQEKVQVSAWELGTQMKELGVETVIFTDIARDGMLSGPNIASSLDLAEKTGLKVIISGGVSGLVDIEEAAEAARKNPLLSGIIVGKALYTGAVNLAEALDLAGGEGGC